MKSSLFVFFFISCFSFASPYEMDLPVFWQQKKLGELIVMMDGMSIRAISKKSMIQLLSKSVDNAYLSQLEKHPTKFIALNSKVLVPLGIQFDSRDVKLNVMLAQSILSTAELNYKGDLVLPTMSKSAKWSILNNLQLQYFEDENQISQLMDWNIFANVGGHKGINFDSSLHVEQSDLGGRSEYRGDTYLYYEDHTAPFRVSFGDVNSDTEGHANSGNFGGINISPHYRQLQPNRVSSPVGSQQFYLPQVAQVEVFINGYLVVKTRLNAGKYDLDDLPLSSGENDVSIVATYANGEVERFEFSEFFNPKLLEKGKYDYDITLGTPTKIVNSQYHYGNQVMLTGFLKYGFSNDVTAATNISVSDYGHIFGISLFSHFDFGNLYSRLSQSEDESGEQGYAFTLNSEHFVWGKQTGSVANLRFTYEQKEQFSSNFWLGSNSQISNKRMSVSYALAVADNVDSNLSFSRNLNETTDNYSSAQLNINWRIPTLRVTASYKHNSLLTVSNQNENQLSLDFSWYYYNPNKNLQNRVEYKSNQNRFNAKISKLNKNYVGDTGYQFALDTDDESESGTVEVSHTQKYYRVNVAADHQNNSLNDKTNYRANMSTSIAISDGKIGVGNNIRTPFAIITQHESLSGSDVLINSDHKDDSKYKSYSNQKVAGLANLGTPYSTNRVSINVQDAPLGYDLGPGIYEVIAGANSAYSIEVGSDAAFTVLGYLLDTKGNAISLKRGVLNGKNGQFKLFTNSSGRFVIEGIKLGTYTLNVGTLTTTIKLNVEQRDSMLIRVGKLHLMEVSNE